MNVAKLQCSLPMIEGKLDFKTMEFEMTKPYSFVRDGMLFISAESDDMAGDYESGFINEKLQTWVKSNKGYFEWFDSGSFVFSPN